LIAQKVKEQKAEQEVKSIDLFKQKVESAPEDKKFMVYTEGMNELRMKGIRFKQEGENITFRSPNLKPSKTPYQYEWSKTDKTGRTLLSAQDISAGGIEVYGGGKLIGAGLKGAGAVGKTLGLAKASTLVNPTTQAFSTIKGAGAVSPTLVKGATYATLGGVMGVSKVQEHKATPDEYKTGFWTRTAGQAIGIGALGYEGYKTNKVMKQTNIQKQATYQKQVLRKQQLQNIKDTGQYTDYTKYGYKQKGVGANFKKQIYKTGESTSYFKEASRYKKVIRVKSPTGLKDYTTSKYGYSRTIKVDGKSIETAYEYRLYKGKPVSIVKLETIGKGNYGITKQFHLTKSGNIKLDKTFVTKSVIGSPTEVKLTTRNTFTTPKSAWKGTPKTMKVAEWNTARMEFGGEKGYLFTDAGQGKPYLATKGPTKPMVLSKTKPVITSTKNPYASITKPTKTYTPYSSNKLAKPSSIYKIKTITATTTTTTAPKIPTLSIGKLRPPTLALATSTSSLTAIGGLTTTALTSRTATTPKLSPSFKSISNVRTTITPISITSPTSSTSTITTGRGITRITNPISPRIPTISSPPIIPILIPPTTLGMVGGVVKKSKVGSKQRYAYTPSYTALVKGIKGKKPKKKKYTGLELRPITKGWLKNIYRKIR